MPQSSPIIQEAEVITADSVQNDMPANTTSQLAVNTARLANSLGYEGELTIGTLEDGIRFYQQRTAESCLEMGKRLLILKEMCPHGEFIQRIETLGFATRTAQKFMQATLKFANANTSTLIRKAGSQSKLLELVTLDDDQIEALSEGGSVGDIVLDDLETMSVRELKAAIKAARQDASAKDELLSSKNQKIDELDAKLSLRHQPNNQFALEQEMETHITSELAQSVSSVLTAISQFNASVITLKQQADEHASHLIAKIEQDLSFVYGRIAELATAEGIDINLAEMITPDWMADIADFELTGQTLEELNAQAETDNQIKARERTEFQAFRKSLDPDFETDE